MKCRATTKRQEPCGKAALDKPQLGEMFSETAFLFSTTCVQMRGIQNIVDTTFTKNSHDILCKAEFWSHTRTTCIVEK